MQINIVPSNQHLLNFLFLSIAFTITSFAIGQDRENGTNTSNFSMEQKSINAMKGKLESPVIVRISIGHFRPEQTQAVAQKLVESEKTLRPAIEKLKGNLAYYVAIDKEKNYMTNTSIWKTLEDAQQMSTLKEMLDLRKEFETLGIEFITITNHETLWSMTTSTK